MQSGQTSQEANGGLPSNLLIIGLTIIIGLFIVGGIWLFMNRDEMNKSDEQSEESAEYNPEINPEDFTSDITNKYFTLPVGRVFVYEGETEDGLERIEIEILDETKTIMGVETIVYLDTVWLDGELVEETRDYLAQDKDENVWYFGEDVNNYANGELINHHGAWIAGENGALPGIWIKGNHEVGDSYRQEYLEGEAEDMRDVLSVDETVEIEMSTYENCVKMYDWTPLDPDAKEHKYYCPEVGAMVLEVNVNNNGKVELIEVR